MAEELIISVSGLRGIVGENLTAVIAAEYGSAFGTLFEKAFRRTTGKTYGLHRPRFQAQRPDVMLCGEKRIVFCRDRCD